MLSGLHSAEAPANLIPSTALSGISGQRLAKRFKIVDVSAGLIFAPGPESISANPEQVGFGTTRETDASHGSARRGGKVECFADPRKHVALGDTTGVTFIKGSSQSREFRLKSPLFALQGP
jgi:hypothetical protein